MNRILRLAGIGVLAAGGVALLIAVFVVALLIGPFILWRCVGASKPAAGA